MKIKFKVTPRFVAKKATTLVVGGGVHIIVHRIIRNSVDDSDLSKARKVQVTAAEAVITSMVTSKVANYTDSKIDGYFDTYDEARAMLQKMKTQTTEPSDAVIEGNVIE